MPEQRNALTELVQQQVGSGKRYSTREFVAVAVDSETQWAPSKSLLAKIIGGQNYNVTPQLVSALAAGLGLDRSVVAAAAHMQVIGYTAQELTKGAAATVIRTIGADSASTDKADAVAERWANDEA
jgi:hypothetical protein